ncbi:MAG: MMPL family transporter, partial [Myxococcota bacterium]
MSAPSRPSPTWLRRVQDALFRRRHHVLAAIGLLTGVAAMGLARIEPAFDPRELVPGGGADVEARLEEAFRGDVSAAEVVMFGLGADDVLAPDVLRRVDALGRRMAEVPGVVAVDSLTRTPLPMVLGPGASGGLEALEAELDDAPLADDAVFDALVALSAARPDDFPSGLASVAERLGGTLSVRPLVAGETPTDEELARGPAVVAGAAPLLEEALLSPDHRRTIVVAHLAPGQSEDEERATVQALMALGEDDPSLAFGGLPAIRDAFQGALEEDPIVLVALAMLGNLIVLAFGFRRLGAVAIPLSAAGITLGLVLGGLGWSGARFGVLHSVVPPLLITLAISDAVHLLARFDEERDRGHGPLVAAQRAFRAMAVACFATSATTAIGFGSLVLAETAELRGF